MTKEEYQQLLDGHDWYYDYSDYHPVWLKGKASHEELVKLYTQQPELKPLYDTKWNQYFGKKDDTTF